MKILFIGMVGFFAFSGCKTGSNSATSDLEAAKAGTKTKAKVANFVISCAAENLGEDGTTIDIFTPGQINDFSNHTFKVNSPIGIWDETSARFLTWEVSGTTLSAVINQNRSYNQVAIEKLQCGGGQGGHVKLRKHIGGFAGMAPDRLLKDCTCKYTK